MGEDRDDDRGVGTGEGQIGQGRPCGAGLTFGWGLGFVNGGTDPFCARVDGESRVSASSAECVSGVPVEVVTALGVLGCYVCREIHRAHALDEAETARRPVVVEFLCGIFVVLLGSHVDSEMWCSRVILEAVSVLIGLVETEKDELRGGYPRVERFCYFLFCLCEGVLGDDGLDVVVGEIVNFCGTVDQGTEILEGHELCGWVGEGAGEETMVVSEEGYSVQGGAAEVVDYFFAEFFA